MSECLTSMHNELSIDERKWIIKCRIEDIDLNTNRKWLVNKNSVSIRDS